MKGNVLLAPVQLNSTVEEKLFCTCDTSGQVVKIPLGIGSCPQHVPIILGLMGTTDYPHYISMPPVRSPFTKSPLF